MQRSSEHLTSIVIRAGFFLALVLIAVGVAWIVNFSAWLILFVVGALLLAVSSGSGSRIFTLIGGVALALGTGSLAEVVFDLPGVLLASLGTILILVAPLFQSARTAFLALGFAVTALGIIVYLQSLGLFGYVVGSVVVALVLIFVLQHRSDVTS